ncbi:conserved hypothetical protein [Neospora caninum Liverpool]|uniref:GPI ethanolamine phosphate transferase 3 n=1 Tax=Neospora caninum (strain Liverpool) TaxID=572307 RepID=F0VM70_NEOCL|nr:conserved hypothetical protein [Neospora caninum Liverpool]CBZ54348.1 conserved hypothetical protein [Neospora caninum Liverpool]|eukprot:XP_003884379.1 conserved hypothetical protein [Neospora caninum Liverpool]
MAKARRDCCGPLTWEPLGLLFGIGLLLVAATFFFLKGFFLSRIELGVFSSSELPFPPLFLHLHPYDDALRAGDRDARPPRRDEETADASPSCPLSPSPACSNAPPRAASSATSAHSWVSVYPYEQLLLLLVDALRFDFAWWEPGKRPAALPPNLLSPRFSLTPPHGGAPAGAAAASTAASTAPSVASAPPASPGSSTDVACSPKKPAWTQPRDLRFFSQFFGDAKKNGEDEGTGDSETGEDAPPHHNHMPSLHFLLAHDRHLVAESPFSSRLFVFEADAPTATTQRLKALGSGTLPTFFEVRESFASSRMTEDSLLLQLRNSGRASVALGDDTWESLFGHLLTATHCSPSFDIHDIHTVDDGVLRSLGQFLPTAREAELFDCFSGDADVLGASSRVPAFRFLFAVSLQGHFLGVDHVGHKADIRSPLMGAKLRQMDRAVLNVAAHLLEEAGKERASRSANQTRASACASPASAERCRASSEAAPTSVMRTLLMVMGDHGMTDDGAHGGSMSEEVDAALFVFSMLPFSFTSSEVANLASPLPLFPTPLPPYIRHHSGLAFLASASGSSSASASPLYRPRRIRQVDWTSTAALLLGVPIPFSAVGSLIPDIVPSLSSFVPSCAVLSSSGASPSSFDASLAFRCSDLLYVAQLQHIVAWHQRRSIDAYARMAKCTAVVDHHTVRQSWERVSGLLQRLQSLLARLPLAFKRRLTMQTDRFDADEGEGRAGNGKQVTEEPRPSGQRRANATDKPDRLSSSQAASPSASSPSASSPSPSSPSSSSSFSGDSLVAEIFSGASDYAVACAEFSRAVFDASKLQFSTTHDSSIFAGVLLGLATVLVLRSLLRLHENREPTAQHAGSGAQAASGPTTGASVSRVHSEQLTNEARREDPTGRQQATLTTKRRGGREAATCEEAREMLPSANAPEPSDGGFETPSPVPWPALRQARYRRAVYCSLFCWWRSVTNFYGTFVVGSLLTAFLFSDCFSMREHAAVRFLLSLAVAAVGLSLFLASRVADACLAIDARVRRGGKSGQDEPNGTGSLWGRARKGDADEPARERRLDQAAARRESLRGEKVEPDPSRRQRQHLRANMLKVPLLLALLRIDGFFDPVEALPGSQPEPVVVDSALLSSFLVFVSLHLLASPLLESSPSSSSSSRRCVSSPTSFRGRVAAATGASKLSSRSSVVQWSMKVQFLALSLYVVSQVLASSSFSALPSPATVSVPSPALAFGSYYFSELPFFLSSPLLSSVLSPVFAVPSFFFFSLCRCLLAWTLTSLTWISQIALGCEEDALRLADSWTRLVRLGQLLFTSKGNIRLLERHVPASTLQPLQALAHQLVLLLPRLIFLLSVLTTGYALATSSVFALPFWSRSGAAAPEASTNSDGNSAAKPERREPRRGLGKDARQPCAGTQRAVAIVVRCMYTLVCGLLPSFMVLLGNAKMFPLFLALAETALLLDLFVAEFRPASLPHDSAEVSHLSLPEAASLSDPPPSVSSSVFVVPDGLLSAAIVLLAFHVFAVTGHRMTFKEIPVEAAFVGLSSFHSVFSLVLTFFHVFFPFLLLPLVLSLLLALRAPAAIAGHAGGDPAEPPADVHSRLLPGTREDQDDSQGEAVLCQLPHGADEMEEGCQERELQDFLRVVSRVSVGSAVPVCVGNCRRLFRRVTQA